jgi:uncharacterized membrane protein YidH (DUF202 family)
MARDPNPRRFPADFYVIWTAVAALLLVTVSTTAFFDAIAFFRHPTQDGWLMVLRVASALAIIGTLLLVWAKAPQYAQGEWWRAGRQHLPAFHRKLYAISFALLIPAILTLLALLANASRVR